MARLPLRTRARLASSALVALGSVATPPALATSPAGDGGADAAGSAAAVQIVLPGDDGVVAAAASAPPAASAAEEGFRYPADGSVVETGALAAETATAVADDAAATASASAAALSLFGGEITADAIRAAAEADAARGDDDGLGASAITGLVVLGTPVDVTPGQRIDLGDWGYAITVAHAVDAAGLHEEAVTIGLRVVLTAPHAGLPAGAELYVGMVQAEAEQAAPDEDDPSGDGDGGGAGDGRGDDAPEPHAGDPPAADGGDDDGPRQDSGSHAGGSDGPRGAGGSRGHDDRDGRDDGRRDDGRGDGPPAGGPHVHAPTEPVRAALTRRGYVFPVASALAVFGNTFAADRALTGWHHGEDIFAAEGTPVVAVADGTLFNVGWNPIGGWRLWVRDRHGNEFYYAHLSAYAPVAKRGATVSAGEVIGFVGDTGDAKGTPPHLHFEVHPAQLVDLGYDRSAVAPYPYLVAWRSLADVSLAAAVPALEARPGPNGEHPVGDRRPVRYERPALDAPVHPVGAADRTTPYTPAHPGPVPARTEPLTPPVAALERRILVTSPDGKLWIDRRQRLGAGHSEGFRPTQPG